MIIQCASSQALAGRLNGPENVMPAGRSKVSPQLAVSIAVCKLSVTTMDAPGAGVSDIMKGIAILGSSAGPSKLEAGGGDVVESKIARTLLSAFSLILHTPVPEHAPPHPTNNEPDSARCRICSCV